MLVWGFEGWPYGKWGKTFSKQNHGPNISQWECQPGDNGQLDLKIGHLSEWHWMTPPSGLVWKLLPSRFFAHGNGQSSQCGWNNHKQSPNFIINRLCRPFPNGCFMTFFYPHWFAQPWTIITIIIASQDLRQREALIRDLRKGRSRLSRLVISVISGSSWIYLWGFP